MTETAAEHTPGPVAPAWADDMITAYTGDAIDVLAALAPASIAAIVTDPPYGLEFMGAEWDQFRPGGARIRQRSERDSEDGAAHNASTWLVARNMPEAYSTGAGRRGKPGIGDRPTEWVSNQGWNGHRCRTCQRLSHGGSPCTCENPDFAPADQRWSEYQQWCQAWAEQCYRVLKPGGFLLAFGGARTWHRLTCGIEDAGFEIRDSIASLTGQDAAGLMWVYGEGMPKNLDAGRAIDMHLCGKPGRHFMRDLPRQPRDHDHVCDELIAGDVWRGWGTGLKPAWEPVIVARKPLAGTLARNLTEREAGALNIDACRTGQGGQMLWKMPRGMGYQGGTDYRRNGSGAATESYAGRWPPNVLLAHTAGCQPSGTRLEPGADEVVIVWDCAADCPAGEMDRQSGSTVSRIGKPRASAAPGRGWGMTHTGAEYTDDGGASRYFPVFRYAGKAGSKERPRTASGVSHPTVKPVDVMRWLVRLVTPPGGTVLDLFAGSGTTGEACLIEGFACVLVERDPAYAELIRVRLGKPVQPVL